MTHDRQSCRYLEDRVGNLKGVLEKGGWTRLPPFQEKCFFAGLRIPPKGTDAPETGNSYSVGVAHLARCSLEKTVKLLMERIAARF